MENVKENNTIYNKFVLWKQGEVQRENIWNLC